MAQLKALVRGELSLFQVYLAKCAKFDFPIEIASQHPKEPNPTRCQNCQQVKFNTLGCKEATSTKKSNSARFQQLSPDYFSFKQLMHPPISVQ